MNPAPDKKLLQKIEKLKAQIAEFPEQVANYIELGKLYFLTSQFDRAIETYQEALGVDDRSVSAYFNLAVAFEAKQKYEEAKGMYRRILEIDPVNQAALEALSKITAF